jgi:putative redox protein
MAVKVELKRVDENFHFEAVNDTGNAVQIDASADIGGSGKGTRPMQLLLMALGGCSGIDIVLILKKQKQQIEDFSISIEGEREEGQEPSLYKNISVVFNFKGEIDKGKLIRAVDLSMKKYCSVAKTLEKTAHISYKILLNSEQI